MPSVADTVRLALDCCYSQASGDQQDLQERLHHSVAQYCRENPQTRQTRYNLPRAAVQEVERLRRHLDISSLLFRQGVLRPLALLRDQELEQEPMRRLFSAVLAKAEGARPPLEPDGWRAVFRDLQLLHTLLPVVGMEGVVSSYCESLLSSGVSSSVSLAGPVLEGMLEQAEQVTLVEAAWRHYYSTAAGLEDPLLELARQVLGLLQPAPRELDKCWDLLAALQSMQDFGLGDTLPLTILEARDRLQFVRRAVEARPTAYRNSQRLMKLASLLGVHAGGMEGQVWAIISRRALEAEDQPAALAACSNMVRLDHAEGWRVCYALAARGEFKDLGRCRELLAFAASHCEGEHLEEVLRALVSTEHRVLGQGLELRHGAQGDEEEMFEDTVEEVRSKETSPVEQLLAMPALSRKFLQSQSTHQLWQQTQTWVARLSSVERDGYQLEEDLLDQSLDRVRMPAFYLSPSDSTLESGLDCSYDRFTRPNQAKDRGVASYQVLRLGGLASTLATLLGQQEQQQVVTPELLQQVLPLVASQDLHLGLLLLLALPSPTEGVTALLGLPRTLAGLSLCLTHWSMLLLAERLQQQGEELSQMFRMTPKDIVLQALVLKRDSKKTTDLQNLCFEQLEILLELATDFHQGEILSSLSGDVDVARFARDPEYREDTILGLALFTEQEQWLTTLTLARRYTLCQALVASTHLEALLTDPGLGLAEAERLAAERGLVALLEKEASKSSERLELKLLPLLEGEDVARLMFYYEVQEKLGQEGSRNHIINLKRLQEERVCLDYSLLVSGSQKLLPLLTATNVEVVSELRTVLGGPGLTSSAVLAHWAAKAFMEHGRTKDNWIEAFSLQQGLMDRMVPKDLRVFLTSSFLSKESLEAVPRPARGRIFKKAVGHVEVMVVKEGERWRDTEAWLARVKEHSERFRTKLSQEVVERMGEEEGDAVDMFELTGGEEEEVARLVCGLVFEGRMETAQGVMRLWKQRMDVEVAGLDLVEAVVKQLSGDGGEVTKEPLAVLELLASQYDLPVAKVVELVTPLCTDDQLAVQDKLLLIKLVRGLQETPDPGLDSSALTELYQAQAEVEEVLPGFVLVSGDLEGGQARGGLFARLLEACTTAGEVASIEELARQWQVEGRVAKAAVRMLLLEEEGSNALKLLEGEEELEQEEVEELLAGCREEGEVWVKLVLQLGVETRYGHVVEVLSRTSSCSPGLATLLVQRCLAPRLVLSPIQPALCTAVLEQGQDTVKVMVGQLREAGYGPLAASLQVQDSVGSWLLMMIIPDDQRRSAPRTADHGCAGP